MIGRPGGGQALRAGGEQACSAQETGWVGPMKQTFNYLALMVAIASAAPQAALAQDNPFQRGRYTDATTRTQPDYDPKPIQSGAFLITSSLGLSAEANDNVLAASSNTDSDVIIRIRPNIQARSDWAVHALSFGGSVNHREYVDFKDETATDYNAFLNGRIDVSRDVQISLGGDIGHVTEERYTAASAGAVTPPSYDYSSMFAQARFRNDRILMEGSVGFTREDFDQMVQDFRDRNTAYVDARVSYAVSPDVAFFLQARQSEHDFSNSDRDGSQTLIDAGVNFELAAPFRGEIAVGNFQEARDNPIYGDVEGLNVRSRLQWFPSDLTTLTLIVNRGVIDPGLGIAASAINTTFGLRADHELYRNILLFGEVRQEADDYQGSVIDREDDAFTFVAGGAYKLNRNMHAEIRLFSRSLESSGLNAGPENDVNVITAGIRFFP
jgi:hypothetical protein